MTKLMTTQEVFTKVATHLLKQNRRSLLIDADEQGTPCAYRGADGLKCAAGVLINDGQYDETLENHTSDSVVVSAALERSGVSSEDLKLVRRLQLVHDRYQPEEWSYQLYELAKGWGLDPDEVMVDA